MIQTDNDFRPRYARGPILALKLLLVTLVSIGLMVFDGESETTDTLRDGLTVALAPIIWAADLPQRVYSFGVHLESREELIRRNQALQHEHLRLNARLQKLAVLEAENERIRALLDSSSQIHNGVMIAEILTASLDPGRQQIRINRGARDGISDGQALVDSYGVLGQVVDVTPVASTAVLITDENQGTPVMINRNGLLTVSRGGGDAGTLKLPHLPANADIQIGDLLVTSGLGGRYPPNYPVGYVQDIRHNPGEHFLEVTAVPAARIMQSREILLVRQGDPVPSTASLIDPDAQPGRIADAK